MSPRFITILAVVGIVASGVGVARWIAQPPPASVSGAAEVSPKAESNTARREKFFGGDTARDIRGGQEMKPRW